ncbi:hypothetical protein [Microcoleus sp. PH2017_10_PVI_O_A]|uniref:hypothetical protein n=1 Tax=Microcoleus sp. PH2017_10_PVI_O_A TaxID=2798821 RepID=UPI0025CC649F|nr:hypothetical protein [Microcoleus sp. PH2017_10_PVI_O_A]
MKYVYKLSGTNKALHRMIILLGSIAVAQRNRSIAHAFPQFPRSFRRIVDRHSSTVCTDRSLW